MGAQDVKLTLAESRIIPNDLHPICAECIASCREKYNNFTDADGVYYKDGFATSCSFIPPDEKFYSKEVEEQLRSSGQVNPTEIHQYLRTINELRSPLYWAEANLINPENNRPWRAWVHQRPILLCPNRRLVMRWGRRMGKSISLAVYILWYVFTAAGGTLRDEQDPSKIRRDVKVLLLTPYKVQVDNIFDRIVDFINASPTLQSSVEASRRGSPRVLKIGNSMISGFAAGQDSGNSGNTIRGQDADLVIGDEIAWVSEDVLHSVVNPILYTHTTTSLIVSSTPSGVANDYFQRTCKQRPDVKEFYVPATQHPNWETMKSQVVKDYAGDTERFETEILAKFTSGGVSVYREDLVKLAKEPYSYGDRGHNPNFVYTFGVDWNKSHGTEIAVIGTQVIAPYISFLFWAENIPKKEFTTPQGIHRVVELNRIWHPEWIFVDAGGSDGGDALRLYGMTKVGLHVVDGRLANIVESIDFGSSLEVPGADGSPQKFQTKAFMVNNSVQRFEIGQFKYPASDITLSKQLDNYILLRRNINGTPVYGMKEEKIGDHRLDAVNLAMLAVRLKFPTFYNDLAGINSTIAYNPPTEDHEVMVPRGIVPLPMGRGRVSRGGSRMWKTKRSQQGPNVYWGDMPEEKPHPSPRPFGRRRGGLFGSRNI